MSSRNFSTRPQAKGSSSSRRAVKYSRISFHPIIQIDPAHSKAAEAARRPKGPTVTFAPFTLPSADNPGTTDDSITTDEDSGEEDCSDDEDDSNDEDISQSNPATSLADDHRLPRMPFSYNPLAYPRRPPSALATCAESLNLHNTNNNTNNTNITNSPMSPRKLSTPAPVRGTGPGALLRGEYFSQSRAAKAPSSKPAVQNSNVINLISDDEDEAPSNQQPRAAPSSNYKMSLSFILNKSPDLSPAPLPASLTDPSSAIAQAGQTASSSASEMGSSFGLATLPSKPFQAFTSSSWKEGPAAPAKDGDESDPRQSSDQLLPQCTCGAGIKQKQSVDSAEEPAVAMPRGGVQLQRALQDGVLKSRVGPAACKDSDSTVTIPAGHHNDQPGNGPTGPLSGLLHPRLATAQRPLHGLPSLAHLQVTNVEKATNLNLAHPSPQTENQLEIVTTGAKNSSSQTHTTTPLAKPTPIVGKAGSRYRYGVNKFDTPSSRVSRRGGASCRDRRPGYNTDLDFDSDSDDNDVLASFTTNLKRLDRGRQARRSGAQHRAIHTKGSNGGEKDKRTQPKTSAKGQDEHQGEKKTVQSGVQHTAVPSTGPNVTVRDSGPDAATLALAKKNAAEFEAIKGMMMLANARGGTAVGENFDEPLNLQRARLQIASAGSSGERADIDMRRPGARSNAKGAANDINTHKDGARPAEHGAASHEAQEQPQHTQLRKRKTAQTEEISETHEQTPKKRARLVSDKETEKELPVGQGARQKYPVKLEDDDVHANVGAAAMHANDGANDYAPRTPSSTAGSTTATPTSQRGGTKRAVSSAGLKLRPWDAGYKRPKIQRPKPAPQPKPSKIVSLRYVPANLPPKLRRIMVMGTDPSEPVGIKCFLLGRVLRSQGVGYIELPPEVRRTIYRLLLVAEKPIEVLRGWSEVRRRQDLELHPALFRACRQMHDEATEVLYSENSFTYALRDDAKMVSLKEGESWRLVMPLNRYIHHFRNLKLVLQRSGTEKEEYTKAIYRAIWNLNYMGVNKLKKLTIVIRPHIETDDNQVSMAAYFQSNNDVIRMLKGLRTDFIQIDVHLPATNSETAKSIRSIIDKRIEVDGVDILRQMDKQTEEEMELGKKERRRLAEAQLVKKSKEAINDQLHRLSTRIQNACTKGAAWVLQRGWFIEFESDVVPHGDYMDFAPHDDTDDTDWEA